MRRRARLFATAMAAALAISARVHAAEIPIHEDGGLPFVDCAFDALKSDCLFDSGGATAAPPQAASPRARSAVFGGLDLGPVHAPPTVHGFPTLALDALFGRRIGLSGGRRQALLVDEPRAGKSSGRLDLDREGRYLIKLSVGRRLVTALWDTGTADTRFARNIAAALPTEFSRTGEYHARRDSGYTYHLRRLKVGGIELLDLSVFDMEDLGLGPDVQVILGWDVIRRLDWDFDVPGRSWHVSAE